MIRYPLTLVLLCISAFSFSQKIPLVHSGQVIEKGKALYDSGKYAEAIREFYKVPERDTNYVLMLTEAALTYTASGKYDEALAVCEKGLEAPSPYTPSFLRFRAIAEDKKGNFEKSVGLFKEAINRYPADYGLLYNLGITYYNSKKYEEAADIFFKVLSFNPFHAGSHLNLGRMSIGQGRKVHAMLSLGMYLSISNTDNERLVLLNNFLGNEAADEGSIPVFGVNEPEKLDQVIRAKIAMDKKFKSRFAIDAAVVRQFEMFFDQMHMLGEGSGDPWVKTYLPVYRFIKEKDLIEPFIYHLLSSSSNTNVKKWLAKNDKELKLFFEAVNTTIKEQREVVALEHFGFPKAIQAWYYDNNTLSALGEYTPSEIRTGHWKFFYDNHTLSAEGDYSDKGKKTGTWKYFHNDGTLKSVEDYTTGEVTVYYPDGVKREHFYLKQDAIDGEVELFYPCGALKEKLFFLNDKRQGKGRSYYASGEVETIYEYADNELNGEFQSFFENGNPKIVTAYKNGSLSGDYQSFHANKSKDAEGEYMNGGPVGPWTHYYSNGNVSRKGNYNEASQPVGEWVYYDEAGLLTEKRTFDHEGRLQGPNTHYYESKVHYVNTYKKDILVQTVFYDRDGKETEKHGNPDGTFPARNYFLTGQLFSEGNYKKGLAHGLWKYYNRFGKLVSEYQYTDGVLQGKSVDYYPSGGKKYAMEYKDDALHGYFQEFYKDGTVKREGWFQNGESEQQWLTYHSDGTPETDRYYLRGSLTGPHYAYASDGKLASVETYKNGLLTDIKNYDSKGNALTSAKSAAHIQSFEERYPNKKLRSKFELSCGNYIKNFTRWYSDGKPYYSFTFLNGKKYGPYAYYDITGKVVMDGSYHDDDEAGVWRSFYPNGQLNKTGRYLNGMKDSVWIYYRPTGKISSTITYRRDESHGISRYYSPEGEPLIEKMYLHGDLVAFRVINDNDEQAAWQDFSGTGVISVKNAAGHLIYEESYKDGLRDGYKRLYFENGKLCEEFMYKQGDFEGPYSIFYSDGKLFEKGTFKNDVLEGKMEVFYPDGSPLKVEYFRMGSRHGKATYFGKGNSRKEFYFRDGISIE